MADDKGGTAVFPAGLILRLEDDGVVLGNKGDVVIEGDLSGSLGKIKHVFSEGGSLTVSAPEFAADRIEALEGDVSIKGNVKANRIKGKKVSSEGKVVSQVILADTEIDLQGKSVKADVVMAPQVSFGAETKGRVTAVECDNDLGPSKVKGRFSLADYVDMVANAAEILTANDIPVPESDDDDEEDEEDEPEENATAPPEGGADEDAAVEEAAAELGEELLQSQDDLAEDVEDLAEEDEAPAEAEPPAEDEAPESSLSEAEAKELSEQLEKALEKINEAYQKGEVPPPIVFLQSLVAEKRFDYIKMQINSIWSDLLKYHQKKGLYISNSVTHQFQQIQMLMRRLPSA